jgi:SAM-dependent methyltransferase
LRRISVAWSSRQRARMGLVFLEKNENAMRERGKWRARELIGKCKAGRTGRVRGVSERGLRRAGRGGESARMESRALHDPKAGEKTYYAQLGEAGLRHAKEKPFSDVDCGKYLCNMGALLLMLEPTKRAVLDFGCGTGWTSRFLAKAGYDVTGIDISEDAVRIARALAVEEDVGGLEFLAADYESFVPSREFDYVLFYDALHHAEDEQSAVDAAYRALKPGGVMFAFEPGSGHSKSSGARHAVETYGVHEKDMPPAYAWRLGKRAGFRRKLFLPLPHEAGRAVYRRDFLTIAGAGESGVRLWLEKVCGYLRAGMKAARTGRSGLIVMWK